MKFRDKNIIFFACLIVVVVVFYAFLIYPLKNNLAEIKGKIEEQRINLEITKSKSADLSAVKKDLEGINDKKATLDKMILSSENQLSLFKDIENLAQMNNLTQDYSLEIMDTKTTSSEVKMSIDITGDYLAFLRYFAGLESLNYYVKVISCELVDSPSPGIVTATLQAKTYWQ